MQERRGLIAMKQSFAGDGGGGGAVEEACPRTRTGSGVLIGVGVSVGASLLRLGGNARPGKVRIGAAGEVAALAGGGVSWQRFQASRTRVRTGRSQGAGRVALAGFPGSTWPRTCHGRGPPMAYERAAAEQGLIFDFQKFRDLSVI